MSINIEDEIKKELLKFYTKINNNLEKVNDDCANKLKQNLSNEAKKVIKNPKNYYKNFIIQKYNGNFLNYVGNTTKTKDNIPLSNILESGATRIKRGYMSPRPHFRIAFDKTMSEMEKKIEEGIIK